MGMARAVKTFPPFRRLINDRLVARSPSELGLATFDPLGGVAVGVARVTLRAVRTLSPFGRSPPGLDLTAFDPIEGVPVGIVLQMGVAFDPLRRIAVGIVL